MDCACKHGWRFDQQLHGDRTAGWADLQQLADELHGQWSDQWHRVLIHRRSDQRDRNGDCIRAIESGNAWHLPGSSDGGNGDLRQHASEGDVDSTCFERWVPNHAVRCDGEPWQPEVHLHRGDPGDRCLQRHGLDQRHELHLLRCRHQLTGDEHQLCVLCRRDTGHDADRTDQRPSGTCSFAGHCQLGPTFKQRRTADHLLHGHNFSRWCDVHLRECSDLCVDGSDGRNGLHVHRHRIEPRGLQPFLHFFGGYVSGDRHQRHRRLPRWLLRGSQPLRCELDQLLADQRQLDQRQPLERQSGDGHLLRNQLHRSEVQQRRHRGHELRRRHIRRKRLDGHDGDARQPAIGLEHGWRLPHRARCTPRQCQPERAVVERHESARVEPHWGQPPRRRRDSSELPEREPDEFLHGQRQSDLRQLLRKQPVEPEPLRIDNPGNELQLGEPLSLKPQWGDDRRCLQRSDQHICIWRPRWALQRAIQQRLRSCGLQSSQHNRCNLQRSEARWCQLHQRQPDQR